MSELEVWAVVFSNYEPSEIVALYDNKPAAEQHAADLGDGWHAERWPVASSYERAEQQQPP